jgi:hypothetical protein
VELNGLFSGSTTEGLPIDAQLSSNNPRKSRNMYIDSPQKTMALAAKLGGPQDADVRSLMRMRLQSCTFYYENRNAMPTAQDYVDAAQRMSEATELDISVEQAEAILALYPHARIKIALYGTSDTDVREEMMFAAAHFFLGCEWPVYGDNVDIEAFVQLLKEQAENRTGMTHTPR